ncbi:lipase family protein [Nocardia yamanashiensis]|uniref:lipase family protein n=1 Tax=Nocardia yamanashiensis TaxID=209247 RepID=UPI001E5302C4|nr:lipase family protein [Nocardia yamanashiensis]UGT43433.1 lipase family protein [Nocardia yamanashiensis]
MSIDADAATGPRSTDPRRFDTPAPDLLPADDPFYRPPTGWQATLPGTVLHARPVTVAAFGRIRQPLTAWQLLYRTTDLHGAPDAAATTVMLPPHPAPGPPRVLSHQCAMDSVSSRYFPSFALRAGARALGSPTQFEFFAMTAALARGWIVAVPDHGGMLGAYVAPREPGHRTLDGLRATLGFAPLELALDTALGLIGYSGGGMATAWAAELAGTYAPELNIAGAAAGSPVGDPAAAFLRINGKRAAGLPVMAMAALRQVYPALDAVLHEHTTPAGRQLLESMRTRGTFSAISHLSGRDIGDYTTVPLTALLARPDVDEVMRDLRLGTATPAMPILVVQSVNDQIIAVETVDAQVRAYLDGGARVTYLRDILSEHNSLAVLALPRMLDWLADRFANVPLPESTTTTVRSVLAQPGTLSGLRRMGRTAAQVLRGRKITPHR